MVSFSGHWPWLVVQFEMVHARFLAPLVKARGFGMTTFETRAKLTHPVKEKNGATGMPSMGI